jgi:hypothetical protein
MLYLNHENPLLGDRVQHITGRFGRVTEVRPEKKALGFAELEIKWDNGVADSQYAFANQFILISRAPGRFLRIPRNTLAEMLESRFKRSDSQNHQQS